MADFRTIDDLDCAGKTVLVRADFNVPLRDGKVTDATRIERSAPTITDLLDKGARVVVATHLGRPKGERKPEDSLKPIVEPLAKAIGREVVFADDCVGEAALSVVRGLKDGQVALLENLRYHKGEEKNDPAFVKQLAELADIYVNDAFSTAHRAHASTEGIAHHMPAAAGRLMQAELEALTAALENPERPVTAVIGGAKVSTKLDVLGNLVAKVDRIVIGGGMANTFLFAKGLNVGKSLCETDLAEQARAIMKDAEEKGCEIVLPNDAVVAKEFKEGADSQMVAIDQVPDDSMILDVGPNSISAVVDRIRQSRTVVWNGPMGAFETKPFDKATNEVADEAAKRTTQGHLKTVAGGGDTVAALVNAGVLEQFSYVSTAGGAFLEWLEGKTLPGVAALRK